MELIFLGTGAAWGLPELNCNCMICQEMRRKGEKRRRTSLLFRHKTNLLVDCSPDARMQLYTNRVDRIDGVLISHEHGDHYLGLDELFAFKRNVPRDVFRPIPVYMTSSSWEVIGPRFAYLENMGVIKIHSIEPGRWFTSGEYLVFPFDTDHGYCAKGSVGFVIKWIDHSGQELRLVYTSDFVDLPEVPRDVLRPDYLVIQAFWFNEPVRNTPCHMSFQRALGFIRRFRPKRDTFLVHMGDADMVLGDPENKNAKKYPPKDPLRYVKDGNPYPVPVNQVEWQRTVERIMEDWGLPYRVIVANDGLRINLRNR